MKDSVLSSSDLVLRRRPGLVDRALQRALFSTLAHLEDGRLVFDDETGRHAFGRTTERFPDEVRVQVHHLGAYRKAVLGGSLGVAEAYVAGAFDVSCLVTLARLFAGQPALLGRLDGALARLSQPLHRLLHAGRRNTLRGSRRNIGAHYDLGNAFYRLWLDETLSYSAAIFEHDGQPLAEASRVKNERICRKLALGPGDHVLEIGTGWGAFALHAAEVHGARVTTTTISEEQHRFATELVRRRGLEGRVTVLYEDYRALTGRYDKLVSVEMIEAVGHEFFDTFFRRASELVAPDGCALIQSITIRDQLYEAARDGVDFIKAYVFPGSCIPSVTALLQSATRASDLRLVHLEDLTPHYALTLRHWRERFLAARAQVAALGFSEAFQRSWELYLAYCEAAFWERYLGDVQLVLARPGCRALPILPALAPPAPRPDLTPGARATRARSRA